MPRQQGKNKQKVGRFTDTDPGASQIMFTEKDEVGVHYLHCDALVVHVIVAMNRLGRMLVDDGSTGNILFGSTFDQIDVDLELTAISEPLFSFTGDSLVPQERIILIVDFRESPCHLKKFV
ncbi:Uncharacterized protein Adt_45030 [Abeliophyllum distichum]|uniref:Uncharacterized protein n=1 Tax=Abeliophyllum distichum TaxID=126358 RepID=A0ABD1PCK1_9LAMI